MRALFVNENLGGHRTMHRALASALAAHPEVEADLFDLPAPRFARRAVATRIPGLASLDLDFQPLRSTLAQSAIVRRELARREAEGRRYDVLHAYSQNAVLLSTSRLRSGPSVVSTDSTVVQNAFTIPQRDATRFTRLNVAAMLPIERRVFDGATLVVAQSEWAAASLRDDLGVEPDRLRTIPFGIMPLEVPETAAPDGALPEVTFVGTSLGRKGGDRLLRVWRRSLRERCVLNLVTHEPVPPEPGLRALRDVRPGDPRLVALLSRTAVFALPSEVDKSPYAIVEAMFAGLPVVALRVNAVPELVDHGVTGLLAEDSDDALEAALVALLDDPALARRMGAAGRARARERFDARVTTAALLGVLAEARERFGAA